MAHIKPITDLDWLVQFPALMALEPEARSLLLKHARVVEAPVGTIGYEEGTPCHAYVLRLAGQSRVFKLSSSGREILLYRVTGGETCVLTTTCLLGSSDYPASTIVEEPIRDILVPAAAFHEMMLESRVFRRFVMENYGALISDLIVLLDEVAFHSLDARLAKLLLEEPGDQVRRTHQQLADELGTAREVVSRQLKRFEQKGWLALGRGKLELLDRAALERMIH
ncbi:Crp/Fnr family transcriptional regulator [Methylovorus glucosotrophus]|jgi:CRP/FNR family transcriptional regulator, anaerobic regulatory protein|uniref:Putative transcriptional regulator, Crp/Fnr family n=1 Tax=Methylovorus glucosotrophus (strain SIP3-4) TaxID=582744 RepID=C6XAH7_METGS|nr:Crp/Fnr family transcriptional regulator [Methylovorus glucosotrophus]ACT49909.1 putative transcriptional regulator, Crp/Fnr family [Methylovorus glucosotrophus SIP3-4]